jgi:hypothetical protein
MHDVPAHDLQVRLRCSACAPTDGARVFFPKTRVALILTQFLGEFM